MTYDDHIDCDKAFEKVSKENEKLQAEVKWLKEEINQFRYAAGLLNSMVLSGEKHSEVSRKVIKDAFKGKSSNLQADVEQLKSDLSIFGNHKSNCAYVQGLKGSTIERCDCGFEQAIKENNG